MPEVYVKQGDTKPPLQPTLKFEDGSVMNLANCTVVFTMIDKDGTKKIDEAECKIEEPPTAGKVTYQWVYNARKDTDTPGRFKGEFEVTDVNGDVQTWPTTEDLVIIIKEEYG